jgi:uncharacterized Zn-finger protein
MATGGTPHFHNTMGVAEIAVGTRELMCIGAAPPFDHPHIYIDMGDENDAVCPYCSTLYRYDPTLGVYEARPADAVWAVAGSPAPAPTPA